jgi:CubicO group peptidase (beta-lactamase class C family)
MRAQPSPVHARLGRCARLARLAVASTFLLAVGCGAAPRLARPTSARAPKTTAPLPAGSAELASWIDAYAGGFGHEWGPAFAPSGYLMVTKDGVPIVARSYGHASPKSGATIGPSTQLQLGSVTKQFTAVAVLQLAEKKRVNLTDSVRAHVAGLPREFDAVTLHHLLTHTSGIANYTADPALMTQRDPHLPRERVVASFAGKPLAFVPGEKFDYSNSNYFLLGMVIEKVSGKTYEEYLQANVLGPANMLRSTTAFDPHTFDAALGTTVDASEKVRVVDVWDTPLPFAAGALRSTAIDMVAWDRALTSGKLLNADSERRRTTPEKDDYACGVSVATKSGYLVESHGGRIEGFRSFFARVAAIGVAVVFLSNADDFDASAFGSAVTRMIVEAKPRPPNVERPVGVLDAALAARLAGTYELLPASREQLAPKLPPAVLESVAKMTVTVEGSHIVVKASGQPAFVAFPGVGQSGQDETSAPSFFTKTSGIVLVPAASAGGGDQVSGFRIEQAGLVIEYVRATPGT